MKITQNCIINGMPEDVYHGDPTADSAEGFAEYTSLSSSVALAMMEETEIEAKLKIRRFNKAESDGDESDGDSDTSSAKFGKIAHDKILRAGTGKAVYEVVPFDSFRTNDAKQRRDDLISRGIIPLAQNKKTDQLVSRVKDMESSLHEQLAVHEDFPGLMSKGKGEQSGFYFDKKLGIWLRARFDWLDETYSDIVWDYKTTALPIDRWINSEMWREKYMQPPHYITVHSGITGQKSRFGFIVQRTVRPYLVYVIVIDASYDDEVNARYELAKQRFANCLKTGVWRGAPKKTIHVCPPPWTLAKWELDNVISEEDAAKHQASPKEDQSEYAMIG